MNRKKVLCEKIAVMFCLLLICFAVATLWGANAVVKAEGSSENPYPISTAEQLKQIAVAVDNGNVDGYAGSHFILTQGEFSGIQLLLHVYVDDKLHTEDSFKKQLQNCFRNLCYRKGWKYMGVWERSPENKRLHFHGLFAIPENTLPNELKEVYDYSVKTKHVQKSVQCAYFTERFGRNDFKELDPRLLGASIKYLLKYIEKSGERIVYSKGLYQYFISDIMDEDVLCRTGQEDKKLLLADNFTCWDEGMYMGKVSPEVIAQLRKSN